MIQYTHICVLKAAIGLCNLYLDNQDVMLCNCEVYIYINLEKWFIICTLPYNFRHSTKSVVEQCRAYNVGYTLFRQRLHCSVKPYLNCGALHSIMESVQFTQYIVHGTLQTLHCTLYSERCTVNSVQYTVHSVQFIMYTAQYTL